MTGEREVTLKLGPGQFACVVSEQIAGAYRTWSDPYELMVEPGRDVNPDVVELRLRAHECPEGFD